MLDVARLALPRAKYNERYYHVIDVKDWEKAGSNMEKPARPRKTYSELQEKKWRLEYRITSLKRAHKRLLGPETMLFNGCPERASDGLRWLFS